MTELKRRSIPETPFGSRLRAARKMAGMSMEDLARKLGGLVTKQAISKYEQGRMMPSPEVLEKLVEVLKIATWGASPLRPSGRDLGEAYLRESPAFLRESREPPTFRRAGILSRLRQRGETPEVRKPDLNGPQEHFCRAVQSDAEGDEGSQDHGDSPARPRFLPGPAMDEGFRSLGARRAHYLRDWESGTPLDRIRFRAGERLSAKTGAALKYRIADHLGKYLELESILGLPATFRNPIGGRPARSSQEVESAAARTRECWELGSAPIVNLLGLLEDKGIKIYEARGLEGFEGLSGRYGDTVFVAIGMEYPADRIRFTAAHELGHVLCDFDAAESPEGECHAFGAAFLLPKAALETIFTPSRRKVTLGDLAEIKETFGVSLQAIMYRAHTLGFVGDRQLRSFRETIKAKGWAVTEPVGYEGKERASRFRRLLHYAVAAEILDVGKAAGLAGVTAEELKAEIGDVF